MDQGRRQGGDALAASGQAQAVGRGGREGDGRADGGAEHGLGLGPARLFLSTLVYLEWEGGTAGGWIVDGLWGYEAGQSGVGHIFAWFVDSSVPASYAEAAAAAQARVVDALLRR